MKTVCIIPARLQSVRIPRKNIKHFRGKPIIAYSIELALKCKMFDAVYVSTESEEIAEVARKHGASVSERPPELADDHTGTQEVMRHELEALIANDIPIEYACCIYATAPLLRAEDLRRGYSELHRRGVQYAVSICSDPYLHDAGAYYWGRASAFINALPLWAGDTVMVPLPPSRVCDVNTEADWARAEALYDGAQRYAA